MKSTTLLAALLLCASAPAVDAAERTKSVDSPKAKIEQAAEAVSPKKLPPTPQASAAGEQINWQVLSGGGGQSSSTSYTLVGTVGQTAAGPGSSTSYNLNSGFIQNFTSSGGNCCTGDRGDINGNGVDNEPLDLAFFVDFLFNGGVTPPCTDEADVDADGAVGPLDLSFFVDLLFNGGVSPGSC